MINVFYRNRNTIGQFMVALIFLGTFGFLFTFDGFVSKSQASGCCGGSGAAVTYFASDSSGDFGSDIPMDVETTDGCCGGDDNTPFNSINRAADCSCVSSQAPCSECNSPNECGGKKKSGCKNCSCSNVCEEYVCTDGSQCNGPRDCGYIK